MIAIFAIMFFTLYLVFFFPVETKEKQKEIVKSPKYSAQMKKLWQIAQTSMKERKPFRAEKALLTILKFDEKNAAAYNRLGILYAKSKKYDEAVECFEIAQSLDNNPASIHNVGLIYFETGAYEKAEMAFLQAIAAEGDVPARYIALARVEEKLGKPKKAIEAFENAYELDPKVAVLNQMKAIYEGIDDTVGATSIQARIEAQIARENEVKRRKATNRALKVIKASNANKLMGRSVRSRTAKSKSTSNKTVVSQGQNGHATGSTSSARAIATSGVKQAKQPARTSGSRVVRKTSGALRVIKPHAGRKRI